jgi:hypothetical protein
MLKTGVVPAALITLFAIWKLYPPLASSVLSYWDSQTSMVRVSAMLTKGS